MPEATAFFYFLFEKCGLGWSPAASEGMATYPRAAVERAMKIQEAILRAVAKEDCLAVFIDLR